jgi:elongator complex protein 2
MRILSASSDKSMMIWRPDPDTGVWINEVRVGEIGGNTLGFYGGLFSRDGKHIIAHGSNGSFHLWHNISTDEGDYVILGVLMFMTYDIDDCGIYRS